MAGREQPNLYSSDGNGKTYAECLAIAEKLRERPINNTNAYINGLTRNVIADMLTHSAELVNALKETDEDR